MGYSPCGLTELDMTGLHFTFRRPTGKMTELSAPDPTLSDIYTHTHSTHTWTENNRRTQVHTRYTDTHQYTYTLHTQRHTPVHKRYTQRDTHQYTHMYVYMFRPVRHRKFWKKELTVVSYIKRKNGGTVYLPHPISPF